VKTLILRTEKQYSSELEKVYYIMSPCSLFAILDPRPTTTILTGSRSGPELLKPAPDSQLNQYGTKTKLQGQGAYI
jgi:hypothetical protein